MQHHIEQRIAMLAFHAGQEVLAPTEVAEDLADIRRAEGGRQRIVEQVLRPHFATLGQRMPGAAAEMPALWGELVHLVIRVGFELAGVGDEELDLLGDQPAVQGLPIVHLEAGARCRVLGDEACNRPRHQPAGGRRPRTKAHHAGGGAVELVDLVDQVVRPMHQAPRMFQHQQALAGRRQFLAGAVDQAAADVVLQRLDAAAESRLRKVHRSRRGDEAAVLDKGDEVAELAQVDMHFLHGNFRWNAIAGKGWEPYKGSLLFHKI
ncbi:hypothetical protein EMIT047CA2_10328 [Pseudomonas soli]